MSWAEVVALLLLPVTVLHTLLIVALIRRAAQIAAAQRLADVGPAAASVLVPVPGQGLDGRHHGDVGLDGAVIAILSAQCQECEAAAVDLAAAIDRGEAGSRAVVFVLAPDGRAPDYAADLAGRAEVYLLRDPGHPLLVDYRIRIYPYFLRTDDRAVVRAAAPILADVLPPAAAQPAA